MIVIITEADKGNIIRNEVELWVFLPNNAGDCVIYSLFVLSLYLVHQETVVAVYLYSVMYPGWCPAQFPYRTVFMSCNSNTTDGTSVAGTAYPGFCGVFFKTTPVIVSFTVCLSSHCILFIRRPSWP
jgi:hypothetical protein